ncbi:MAG: L,D-transpeptidase family protein [Rhodothermaceae bacterium]|nr:L,D-transpeptidase family protein [Rhodothermaceae bacterium]
MSLLPVPRLLLTLSLIALAGWGAPSIAQESTSSSSHPGMSADSLVAAHARLQEVLARYQRLADGGGWPTIPDGPLVEPGDTLAAQVEPLRQRLAATGELGSAADTGAVYDDALAGALARFQGRHGLVVDSLLGGNTRAALNRSASERVRQIEQALARWAELPVFPTGPGSRYVLVNVPEFRVRAFEEGREALQMKVVVGADYDERATPLFHDEMEHVVFRPYWNIPPSIATEEVVPKGTAELEAEGYEIISHYAADAEVYPMTAQNLQRVANGSLRIRQGPGPDNALGLVKYIFPNQHAVYLHDTPSDHLFAEAERAFSHGCIRLERPADFGAWVLGPQGWDTARVQGAMTTGDRQKVVLNETIPVYIIYLPVWADADGHVYFAADVYDEIG